MKPLLALLFTLAVAHSDPIPNSATTTPDGFITHRIPPASDSRFAPALHRNPVAEGKITRITGSDIAVSVREPFQPAQFVFAPEAQPDSHYLLVTSGARAGLDLPITANTADSVTVSPNAVDDLTGLAPGDKVSVVPYWTPASFLPPSIAPAGTLLVLFDDSPPRIPGSPVTTLRQSGSGWVQVSGQPATDAAHILIHPDEPILVRTPPGSALTLRVTGQAPTAPQRFRAPSPSPGDTLLANASPMPLSLATLALGQQPHDQILRVASGPGFNRPYLPPLEWSGAAWLTPRGGAPLPDALLIDPGHTFVFRRRVPASSMGKTASSVAAPVQRPVPSTP